MIIRNPLTPYLHFDIKKLYKAIHLFIHLVNTHLDLLCSQAFDLGTETISQIGHGCYLRVSWCPVWEIHMWMSIHWRQAQEKGTISILGIQEASSEEGPFTMSLKRMLLYLGKNMRKGIPVLENHIFIFNGLRVVEGCVVAIAISIVTVITVNIYWVYTVCQSLS